MFFKFLNDFNYMNIISIIVLIIIFVELLISIYTLLFLLNYKEENREIEIKEYPKVSIIVPAYNEEKNIKETIERLIELDYPKEKLEIIVVDDGSKDNTFEIAKEYEDKYNFIKVYKKENGGKASALNYGIKRCTGDYIVVLDADSIPQKDSLKKMIKYFYLYPDIYVVVPSVQVDETKNWVEKYQYIDYVVYNFSRIVLDQVNAIFIAPGPFSVFKKEVFEKVGLFDEKNITEDMEIALRVQKNGLKIKYCPESVIYTKPPDTFIKLLKQRARWFLGFIENYTKYRDIENEYLREFGFGINLVLYILLPLYFSIIIYLYIYQLYNFFVNLYLTNFDIIYFIKGYFLFNSNIYLYQLLSTSALILYIFSIILLVDFSLFISFYRKYDKSKSWKSIILYSIIYLIFSLYFNSIFILVAIYYKIFGRKLRWGGIVWDNSLINKIINKNKHG
ncbi:undecaprenyl-phosphate 4-deoxy-4-formamido-L-arabinose transferase [Nanoarchaeota archaeon]